MTNMVGLNTKHKHHSVKTVTHSNNLIKILLVILDTLKLSDNANDELEKSIKIHQQGFKVTMTTTHYYYDAFGRRIAKSSAVKNQSKLVNNNDNRLIPNNKTIQSEKNQYKSTLMLLDGNRQAQEYTHVFTTVYEQNSEVVLKSLGITDAVNKNGKLKF